MMALFRRVFAGVLLCSGTAGAQMPTVPVVTDAARMEQAEQWREVTGELRTMRRSLLAAQEEGWVVELLHNEGDRVKKSDVIARLSDVRAKLDVRRAESGVAGAAARVAQGLADAEKMERDLARMEEMLAQGAGNDRERDNARTDLNMATARLDQARAEQAGAEADAALAAQRLSDMTITAPFDGVVVQKETEVGQWLQRGDSIVTVVEMDQMEARLDVPERYIEQLRGSGRPVQVRVPALGETLEAPVTAIVPDADRLSRLFPVRARLENPQWRLRPGMSVIGLVPTGVREPTLTIRKDAVRRDDAGQFVFFDEGGKAGVARVETLFAVGDRIAVRSPRLSSGTPVIVQGNERLFPGAPIAAQGPAASPAGGGT